MPTKKWMRMQMRLLKDFGPFVVAKEAFFFACGPWHFASCATHVAVTFAEMPNGRYIA